MTGTRRREDGTDDPSPTGPPHEAGTREATPEGAWGGGDGFTLAEGRAVGPFVLVRRIGEGGMGVVWEAVEPRGGRRVAVKVLRRRRSDDPRAAARMEREARAANAIGHPHIADAWMVGETASGHPFLVMSLYQGQTLRQHLDRHGPLTPAAAWQVIQPVARALDAAHRAGVVHRDLKPENVFLEDREGAPPFVRVMDLGIAQVATGDARLTATGAPLGTPSYMPPEQWWGQSVGPAADVYALAMVWHELLTGRSPFDGAGWPELMQAHLHRPMPRLGDRGVPGWDPLGALLDEMAAKDPAARVGGMDEVLRRGEAAMARGWQGASAVHPPPSGEGEGAPGQGAEPASGGAAPTREGGAPVALPRTRAGRALEVGGPGPSGGSEPGAADVDPREGADTRAGVRPKTERSARPWLLGGAGWSRSIAFAAAWVTLPAAGLVVGYRGLHDPGEILHLAGWGGPAVVLWGIGVGLLQGVRGFRPGSARPGAAVPTWAAALPFVLGQVATATGWMAVRSHLRGVQDFSERLLVFSVGASEAHAGRFLGGLLAGAALLAAAWGVDAGPAPGSGGAGARRMDAPDAPREVGPGTRPRDRAIQHPWTAGRPAAWFLVALALGVPTWLATSGTAVPLVLAIALAAPLMGPADPRTPARARLLALGAVAAVATACLARWDADGALLWSGQGAPGARRDAVARVGEARQLLVWISLASLGVLAALPWIPLGRAGAGRPRRSEVLGAAAIALLLAADTRLAGGMGAERAELWARFEPHLAAWSALDPPDLSADRFPAPAPTLQISRLGIALDGQRIAPLAVLDSTDGVAATLLVAALGPRLRDPLDRHEDAPDLAIAADRGLPAASVGRALRAAWSLGVRSVDVVVAPGWVPPDARTARTAPLVLPTDLRVLRVRVELATSAPIPAAAGSPGGQDGSWAGRVAAWSAEARSGRDPVWLLPSDPGGGRGAP